MLKRVCASIRDWPVTCLERKQLEEAIKVLRCVRIKGLDKGRHMLLSDADGNLPIQTSNCRNSTITH
jgi:hypothetical protein